MSVDKKRKTARVSFDPACVETFSIPISRAIASWKSWIQTVSILTDMDKKAITTCIDRMRIKDEPEVETWMASRQSVEESALLTEEEKKEQLAAIDQMILRGAPKERTLNLRKGSERDDLNEELHAYLQWHLVAQSGDETGFYLALRSKVSFKLFKTERR